MIYLAIGIHAWSKGTTIEQALLRLRRNQSTAEHAHGYVLYGSTDDDACLDEQGRIVCLHNSTHLIENTIKGGH